LVKKTIFAILVKSVDKMSVIQTIRNKYLGLMVALIVVALVGFLVMDGLQSNAGNLFGGGDRTSIATINGTRIASTEFDAAKDLALSNFKSKNPKATEEELKSAGDEAWSQFISDKLMDNELAALGIKVTDKEFQELLTGQYAAPFIQQSFRNQEGVFDPSAVKQYVTQLRNNRKKDAKSTEAYNQWLSIEKQLEKERLVQKYTSLIGLGVYQPMEATKAIFKEREGVASISYVMIPYDSVKETPTVNDADYQAYISKYSGAFTLTQELRRMEYVSWDIIPTAADTALSLGVVNSLASEFGSTSSMEEFIGKNGDELYDNAFHAKGEFSTPAIDSLASQPVGTIVGPYYDAGFYRISKVMEKAVLPDSVQASAIAIAISDNLSEEEAGKRADSIKNVANAANFGALVNVYGDEQSKAKAGDLGFLDVREGSNSNELFVFLQKSSKGQIGKVKQGNQFIVVLVTDQKSMRPKAKIASLSKFMKASKGTTDAVYAKANAVMNGVKDKASFEKAIKDKGLTKRVAEAVAEVQEEVEGLGSARELVRYGFNTEAGKVSGILNVGGDKYVVGLVTNIYPQGLAPVALVRQNLQAEIVRQKKFAKLAEMYKGKNLEAIAAASKQAVKTNDSVSVMGAPGELGQEAKVIGASFNKNYVGKVSDAIYGKQGAYFISVKNIGTRSLNVTDASLDQERQMFIMQSMQNLGRALPEMMRRKSKVEDNRGKFM
jgi:peptidyl-prolyl cis-trans isomerase D